MSLDVHRTSSQPPKIAQHSSLCEHCHLEVTIPALSHKQKAHCPRCNHKLAQFHQYGHEWMIALGLGALILLLFSLPFPFIGFEAQSGQSTISILGAIKTLTTSGYALLAAITVLFVLAIPIALLIVVLSLLVPLISKRQPQLSNVFLKALYQLLPWSMAEVFLLSVLVAMIKLSDMADITFGPGFYLFSGYVLCQTLLLLYLDKAYLHWILGETVQPPRPLNASASIQKTWALLLTASILYVPANLLPIMKTTQLGQTEENSILSGVVSLWQAGSRHIAIIIFVASVMIPVIKIVVMAWLNFSVQYAHFLSEQERIRWYRVMEFIGRWSMVDVFVVAILAGLIQQGNAMAVIPGPAILSFAGVVIMTMIAAMTFDTRLFWQNPSPRKGVNHV
ncbi:paraquat-inducible protein A [Aestuariibacter sp. AA17]|uniref:Paraquat-inducible protein A n=1 Tax=Fluctibacter corallii TaxID=2984329 RepID=A0ABT3ABM2_9ALTE|nr:paraquat-inducible protein A [Aestuariibacter sp. AA17]MCV2885995.1 paraquat-inducible protein A [Aestuariibacter sp. AA17]